MCFFRRVAKDMMAFKLRSFLKMLINESIPH